VELSGNLPVTPTGDKKGQGVEKNKGRGVGGGNAEGALSGCMIAARNEATPTYNNVQEG